MVVTCFIEFENDKCNNYLPGQTVIGKAILKAEGQEEIKAVTLEIRGCADTSWSEKQFRSDKSELQFSGHIDYINFITRSLELANDSGNTTSEEEIIEPTVPSGNTKSIEVIIEPTVPSGNTTSEEEIIEPTVPSGNTTSEEEIIEPTVSSGNNKNEGMIIKPCVHYLPFSCQIPVHCPPSVEGSYGYIRYWVQVTLERPEKLPETFNRSFTVVNANALNLSRELWVTVNTEFSKIFSWGSFKSEPLQISVHLPQRGFTIGQSIPVSLFVENNTKARINEICVRLVMMITYFSTIPHEKSKSETKTICERKGNSVSRNCKENFNYLLPIPSDAPSTCSALCRIIQIAYRLEVDAKMQGILYRNQCVATPVFIGAAVQEEPIPTASSNLTKEIQNANENVVVEKDKDLASSNQNKATETTLEKSTVPVDMEADRAHKYLDDSINKTVKSVDETSEL